MQCRQGNHSGIGNMAGEGPESRWLQYKDALRSWIAENDAHAASSMLVVVTPGRNGLFLASRIL
jgi:hypothetical protein